MKKILGLLLLALAFASCGENYPLAKEVIGNWKVAKVEVIDEFDHIPERTLSFSFREDGTYEAVNEEGEMEKVTDSNPFRKVGKFTGHYKVDAPTGLRLREKYLAPMFYGNVEMKDGKLEMVYNSEDEQRVKIIMEKQP
jgi:hypothetical protein